MPRSTGRSSRSLCALTVCGLAALAAATDAHAAPKCPSAVLNQPKGNQMYLYFATSSDPTFPLYKDDELESGATSPLAPFKVSDLDSSIGTTAQLRNRIVEMVVDDYCEFNVQVTGTTSMPSPSAARWHIVGLGTDSATIFGGPVYGAAQDTDVNDSDPQDFTRVFAHSFKDQYGGPGGALNGANSTLERWATAIGETAAHEAAHNYGLDHNDAKPRPFSPEDDASWHIMATGGTLNGEIRAGRDRHFSDTEYEVLGHNVGLNTKTLHNWDFVNPNDSPADAMRIKILSSSDSLSINWWYDGLASPWQNPTVTYTGAKQNFQGTSYFVHNLDFKVAKGWNGTTPGVVDPGDEFHTGATFAGEAKVLVSDVQLLSNGTLLPLAPRLPGYGPGTFDLDTGELSMDFYNMNPSAGELVLSDVLVFRAPRMIDIGAMMRDVPPVDIRGVPVDFLSRTGFERVDLRESALLPIAKLTDKRTVDIVYGPEDCPRGPSSRDAENGEMRDCRRGNALSLFPATYTYLIATVTDPNARHWDPKRLAFVTGPMRSILYYQLGGVVPDFNGNGIDDLIDIRTGTSRDEDRNGVPDEAQR